MKTETTNEGEILSDGTLEMRDINDNAKKRFQYRRIDGVASRRVLPETGDWKDGPAQWEPLDIEAVKRVRGNYHPLLDYFGEAA